MKDMLFNFFEYFWTNIISFLHFLDSVVVFENSLLQLLLFTLFFFFCVLIIGILQKIWIRKIKKYAEKTKIQIHHDIIKILESITPFFYWYLGILLSAYIFLNIDPTISVWMNNILIVFLLFESIKITERIIERSFFVFNKIGQHKVNQTNIGIVRLASKIILWVVGILMILANLGINISALYASLGIGGIAVALAAQNILGDFFSSLVIYFDRPFEVDDHIVIDDQTSGTIKSIGMRTTRIQTLLGEEVVIPNAILSSNKVHNFNKLKERRTTTTLRIEFNTPTKKLKSINTFAEKIINSNKNARFSRSHFTAINDWSFGFDIVYYITSNDYLVYVDTQQEVYFGILEALEKENIRLALPVKISLQK